MSQGMERSRMGAVPHQAGVSFRVWAPFARSVHVAGDFNAWDRSTHPLASEGNGFWATDVATAEVGQRYKFLVNDVWKLDPYALSVTADADRNGVIVNRGYPWEPTSFRMPAWNELVIYQVHLKTFPDTPPLLSGMLDAAARELWYLRDLGINAVQLLPAAEFPGDTSWGYNPSQIYAVEAAYGGADALKRFVEKAHRYGIAVLLDVVYNHLGPGDLDLWRFDGWGGTWEGQPTGGTYFYNEWQAKTPWGHTRPDYGRPEVRRFLVENALMWLEEFRLDGLRFDSTVNIRNAHGQNGPYGDLSAGWLLLQEINGAIRARQPWKITIAEDMQGNEWLTKETVWNGAGFGAQWEADFVHGVRGVLTTTRDEDRDVGRIADLLRGRYNGNPFERVVYTESHDEVAYGNGKRRLTEDIEPGHADGWYAKKRSTLGAALVMTTPGIPMIFQGQEILEWLPFGDEKQNEVEWKKFCEKHGACPCCDGPCEPNGRFKGIQALYRDLIRLRRNWFADTAGLRGSNVNVFHVNHADKVIAFHRWENGGPGDDVVVVLNFGTRPYGSYTLGMPREGEWKVRLNSDWAGYSADFGTHPSPNVSTRPEARDGLGWSADLSIGPYTALILSQ